MRNESNANKYEIARFFRLFPLICFISAYNAIEKKKRKKEQNVYVKKKNKRSESIVSVLSVIYQYCFCFYAQNNRKNGYAIHS